MSTNINPPSGAGNPASDFKTRGLNATEALFASTNKESPTVILLQKTAGCVLTKLEEQNLGAAIATASAFLDRAEAAAADTRAELQNPSAMNVVELLDYYCEREVETLLEGHLNRIGLDLRGSQKIGPPSWNPQIRMADLVQHAYLTAGACLMDAVASGAVKVRVKRRDQDNPYYLGARLLEALNGNIIGDILVRALRIGSRERVQAVSIECGYNYSNDVPGGLLFGLDSRCEDYVLNAINDKLQAKGFSCCTRDTYGNPVMWHPNVTIGQLNRIAASRADRISAVQAG